MENNDRPGALHSWRQEVLATEVVSYRSYRKRPPKKRNVPCRVLGLQEIHNRRYDPTTNGNPLKPRIQETPPRTLSAWSHVLCTKGLRPGPGTARTGQPHQGRIRGYMFTDTYPAAQAGLTRFNAL